MRPDNFQILTFDLKTISRIAFSMYSLRTRGDSSPKILGRRALFPSAPSSPSPFSPSPKPKKYEIHIGVHLKPIISRVANFVMG